MWLCVITIGYMRINYATFTIHGSTALEPATWVSHWDLEVIYAVVHNLGIAIFGCFRLIPTSFG